MSGNAIYADHQLELFTAPAIESSPTSRAAATASLKTARTLERRIFDFVERRGTWGATDSEIQQGLQIEGNSERPRRVRLVETGRLRDSGKTRSTPAGRPAVVWVGLGVTCE